GPARGQRTRSAATDSRTRRGADGDRLADRAGRAALTGEPAMVAPGHRLLPNQPCPVVLVRPATGTRSSLPTTNPPRTCRPPRSRRSRRTGRLGPRTAPG